jgi:hypothetical protein
MHSAWTARDHVRIEHHVCKSAIPVERMIEMEFDNGLFLFVGEPMIARDLGIVLIRFAITASPLVEGTAVNLGPVQQCAQRDLCLLRPRTDGVNNFVSNIMGNPALF